MGFINQNFGWMIVALLAALPLLVIFNLFQFDFTNGFSLALVGGPVGGERSNLEMLYHVSGEFAIRWMTAVLMLTPFFIVFGVTNLFVRQAMGIATAVWSCPALYHFYMGRRTA